MIPFTWVSMRRARLYSTLNLFMKKKIFIKKKKKEKKKKKRREKMPRSSLAMATLRPREPKNSTTGGEDARTTAAEKEWAALPHDIVVGIFARLGVEELAAGAPLACRAWYAAASDPGLWRGLDLSDWHRIRRRLAGRDGRWIELRDLLAFAVARGRGALESIRFPNLPVHESDFLFVAYRCPNIKFFYLRWAMMITNQAFCMAIIKWTALEGMDIDEHSLQPEILKQIGSSCKNFVYLRVAGKLSVCAACSIVDYLPKLKSINLSDTIFLYEALVVILRGCEELESLDITGSGKLGVDPEVQKLAANLKEFHYDKEPVPEEICCFCPNYAAEDYYMYGIGSCACVLGD